ncbi:MAG: RHS repeat-associated core domain-containing protein [Planctomycetia bacterium]|nr:RHS repeat-associated core domain-containing protein [Planctomycetia bacterium]
MPPFGSPTISFHVHRVGALGEFDKILIQHLRIFHESIFMPLTYLLPTRSPRTARRVSFDTGRKSVCRLFPYIEGNRISKTNSTNRELYEWDYRNRLTSVTQQEFNTETQEWTTTQTIEYTYDYNNVWIRKIIGNDKTIFIPENYQTVAQIDNATISHHYLWTPGQQDKLLADVTSNGALWSLCDHLGTIRDIIQSTESGVITQTHIIYDAYGNVVSCTDFTGQTISNLILFGYTGKPFDTSTSLQNNINRWYDASIGRWLSQDPIGFEDNDSNLYRYVYNNTVKYWDALGLKTKCDPDKHPEPWDFEILDYLTAYDNINSRKAQKQLLDNLTLLSAISSGANIATGISSGLNGTLIAIVGEEPNFADIAKTLKKIIVGNSNSEPTKLPPISLGALAPISNVFETVIGFRIWMVIGYKICKPYCWGWRGYYEEAEYKWVEVLPKDEYSVS